MKNTYLGDGIFIEEKGGGFKLTRPDPIEPAKEICLDAQVSLKLLEFLQQNLITQKQHYYTAQLWRERPANQSLKEFGEHEYAIFIIKADSYFNAKKKAEAEMPKWQPHGWKLRDVFHQDREKIDAGDVVCLGMF